MIINPILNKSFIKTLMPKYSSRASVRGCAKDILEISPERKTEQESKKIILDALAYNNEVNAELVAASRYSDPSYKSLNNFIGNYLRSKTLENKKALIEHEENMLWQELATPAVGIVRAIYDGRIPLKLSNDNIENATLQGLRGVQSVLWCKKTLGLPFSNCADKYQILENILKNKQTKTETAASIKKDAISIGELLFDYIPSNEQARFKKVLAHVADDSSPKVANAAKKALINLSKDKSRALQSFFSDKSTVEEKKEALIYLALKIDESIAKQLPELIKNNSTNNDLRISAAWAAGRIHTDENFAVISQIAKDSKEQNLELREMALHSTAMYLKKKPDEVKSVLKNTLAEKSDLSELAQVLLDKAEGKYYRQNRELSCLSPQELQDYNSAKSQYIQVQSDFNIQKSNLIDRALAPFAKAFAKLVQKGSKTHITNDSITFVDSRMTGTRNEMGIFWDSVLGVNTRLSCSKSLIAINEKTMANKAKNNVLAHEFNHNFLQNLMSLEDNFKLKELYNNSLDKNKSLDFYAAVNPLEYFAQGYEAYASVYKPHRYMIANNSYDSTIYHVRSTLKRKDPDLYNFIEYCIDKYNK